MTEAREQILATVRRALGHNPGDRAAEYAAITRQYQQTANLNQAQILELFESRVHDYEGEICRSPEADLPATLARVLSGRNKQSMLIADSVPRDWLPPNFDFLHDQELSYQDLDRVEGVLTTCALAIATTGTIVLRHSPEEGRRALSLVPDYHLCIVRAGQIVQTVVEGIRNMASLGDAPLTTISGPSATSDIEMTRVKGVHGPRTLDVVIINSEEEKAAGAP